MTPSSGFPLGRSDHASILRRFSAGLDQSADFADALDVLHEAVGALGFPLLAYAHLPIARRANGSWALAKLHTRNLRDRWDDHWETHGPNDPYYQRCFETGMPVDWADVQRDERLRRNQRDCVSYISDRVAHFGVTVPIHQPGTQFAFVSVLAENGAGWTEKVRQAHESLFLMAHQFHGHLSRHGRLPQPRDREELSLRETECLSWSAQGKTAADTAVILGISTETVRMHLKRINRKLGALNRTQAVAKATLLGWI